MSCSGAAELSSRVPRSLGCSCHLKLQQRSSLSSHDHTTTSHTKDFHDLVFDTVNSLYLQLNLRMSEIHTFQLQQGHIHIGSAQCTVVGCISYCPNPFWLSLAQRRARAISVPCSLTPSLAQPSHNPVSVPFFRSCLWLCVGSCSLVGTWLRESQSTHTHTHTSNQTKFTCANVHDSRI